MNATEWSEKDGVWSRYNDQGNQVAQVTSSMSLWTGRIVNGRDVVPLHVYADISTADAAKHHVDVQLARMGYLLLGESFKPELGDKLEAPAFDRAQLDAIDGRSVTESQIANCRTNPEIVPHPVKPADEYVPTNDPTSSDRLHVDKLATGGNMTPVGHDRIAATANANDTPSTYVPGDGFPAQKAQSAEDSTNPVRDDGVVPQAIEKSKVDSVHDSVAPKSHKSNWPKSNRF